MIVTRFKQVFKGVEYDLTLREWSVKTGVALGTIYGRHTKWKKGVFPEKDILYQGILESNSRPRIERIRAILTETHPWILRKERWITAKLKWLYLNQEPSAYMNQVRQ